MTNGKLEKGDVVIPKWAAGIIATIIALSFVGAFGWAWAMNADMAVLKRDVSEIKEEIRGRAVSDARNVAVEGFQ